MKKRIAVLGATGSIGKSALSVISKDRENFEVVLLSAHRSNEELKMLNEEYPAAVCILSGEENLLAAIKETKPDITVNGISGAAGLEPSIAAIEAGSNLALANKETVVMASDLVFRLAQEKNVKIIPVDSEHSAVFKLIENFINHEPHEHNENLISEIILTASGGPFRKLSIDEMKSVTPKAALAHPTWNMGPKITIDSATMANKGLEIIEACAFFNMPPEKVKVVIHPQSIVHSMVKLCNGIIYAQLSKPDMRHPIHDALYWPKTYPSSLETLNFDSLTLEFEKPNQDKFPMLKLAYQAAKNSGLYPCAYNAANEEAVKAFLEEKIGFLDIPRITESVLQDDWNLISDSRLPTPDSLSSILQTDAKARQKAIQHINKMM